MLRTNGRTVARAVVLAWLALTGAAQSAMAAERTEEIWVGETITIKGGRTQIERGTVKATSGDPDIATAKWGDEDTGPLIITGVKEGKTLVTLTGKVRLMVMGTSGSKDAVLRSRQFTEYVDVKVIDAEVETRMVRLHKDQEMTINLARGARIASITVADKAVLWVHKNTLTKFTLNAKEIGLTLVTVKFTRRVKGRRKKVTGLIYVLVYEGKREGPKIKKDAWGAMPEPTHKIIILPPRKKKPKPPAWPPKKGVKTGFIPSGRNYGDVGDLVIKNTTGQPVTVTIPPGLLLDSFFEAVQDLYLAVVAMEKPCEGAKYIGKPFTIQPGQTVVVEHLPGFCPDFEKDPPKKNDTAVYACRQPDKKSKALLDTIAAAKTVDVGKLKLEVFGEKKARAMITQGALWAVDSHVDDEQGNEVSNTDLTDRFYGAFTRSAKAALDKMPPENRKQAEKLVKDDIKKMVGVTDFLAKGFKRMKEAAVKG